jgi:hypothetical protein
MEVHSSHQKLEEAKHGYHRNRLFLESDKNLSKYEVVSAKEEIKNCAPEE